MANTNTGTEGARLHRLLVGELAAAGCFRPAPMRSIAYRAFILAGYAGAYAALLSQSGAPARAAALMALAFLSVHAGFLAHEAGHGALTRNRAIAGLVGRAQGPRRRSGHHAELRHALALDEAALPRHLEPSVDRQPLRGPLRCQPLPVPVRHS
jgi:hypothetical protein